MGDFYLWRERLRALFNLLAVKYLLRSGQYQAVVAYLLLIASASPDGYVVNSEGLLIDLYMDMDKLTGFSQDDCNLLLEVLKKYRLVQELDSGVFYLPFVAGWQK